MVTKKKVFNDFLLVLFMFCALPASAQNHQQMIAIASKNYQIQYLKMSENAQWYSFKKVYDANSDTLVILDRNKADKVMGFRTKVHEVFFLKQHLLLKSEAFVEILDLSNNSSNTYHGNFKLQILDSGQFVLYETLSGNLSLYNEKGSLLNSLNQVTGFFTDSNDKVYATVKHKDSGFFLVELGNKPVKEIYKSSDELYDVSFYPDQNAILIKHQDAKGLFQDLVFISEKSGFRNSLTSQIEVLPKSVLVENAFDDYFLVKAVFAAGDNDLVDIWYGNDNNLEAKFSDPRKEVYYLWNPSKNSLSEVGTEELNRSISIGKTLFSYNPYHFKEYLTYHSMTPLNFYRRDFEDEKYVLLGKIEANATVSESGRYLLSSQDHTLSLYDLKTFTEVEINLSEKLGQSYFSSDDKTIFFDSDIGLWKYDINADKLSKVKDFSGYRTKILNARKQNLNRMQLFESGYDRDSPMLIELLDLQSGKKSWVVWDKGKTKTLIDFTSRNIESLTYDKSLRHFTYKEEDYNLPPRIVYKDLSGNSEELFQSNPQDNTIRSLRMETYTYLSAEGAPLKGVLYYPLGYDESKVYPMVVHIYQIQSHRANIYPISLYSTPDFYDGFNLRSLLEQGYFVFLPDIVFGEKGTGLSALSCVHNALDAIAGNSTIDFSKVGLIGHSHGGYQTNFIATHSDRFAAFVSGSGTSDIVRSYFSFNYNFFTPFYYQYEKGQYEMGRSFSEDKDFYFRNNPVHYAERVKAPILLWTGMLDQNIDWEQTMEFYIALKRNEKKVIALFYPQEGHSLLNENSIQDLGLRVLQWFNYFLKEQKDKDWIDKEMKKDAD